MSKRNVWTWACLVGILGILFSECSYDPDKRKLQQYISQGRYLYQLHCEACHTSSGKDDLNLNPPLAQSDYFLDNPLRTACIIEEGIKEPLVVNDQTYDIPMPAIELKADEIAKVICYIGNAWGNEIGFVSTESVKQQLENCDSLSYK